MNIMILTWLFPPSTGGIETNTYRLAKSFSKKNNVSVFTTGNSYNGEEKELFNVFRAKEMDPLKAKARDHVSLSNKMRKVLRDEKIDIVISYNLSHFPTRFSKTLTRAIEESGTPLIEYCQDGRYKTLNKRLANEFQQVLTVSDFVRRRLVSLGYDRKKVKTFHFGVPTDIFDVKKYSKKKSKKMFNLPEDKKIILFPSRAIRGNGEFNQQKGFSTVINSLKDVKEKANDDFAVIFPAVVGRKDKNIKGKKNLIKMKMRLKKDGLEDNVIFIERRVSTEEMPHLYSAADIVLTPSVDEAFATVFLESLSMGIPAIGARSGGTPESIVNGKTGFLIKPGDSKGLAKKIIKLLNNDKLRERMGRNSRKRAVKTFDYDGMILKLDKIFRKTINKYRIGTIKNKKGMLRI